ncbi:hypothetical protein B0T22DRAFT_69636 [Podospora appendiculata]|uniref:Uncharacterized protein n=1 Tax=Podospora appendiculata TaxID=314037 RepID=A0AAE1CHK9_9PEZI|nr:hypothetical protein B0T22DRAFT_69636 [Podospora appendiculata]
MSVQCIYCQQVRAKNTTRQRQHLYNCNAYLTAHPDVIIPTHGGDDDAPADAYGETTSLDGPGEHGNLGFTPNPRINGAGAGAGTVPGTVPGSGNVMGPAASPAARGPGRPALSNPDGTPAPKRYKTKQTPNPNTPELPLREVHAAFVEFKVKEDDKCLSARCIHCNQVRAKNTSRQREHLLNCPAYQSVIKDKIPANNLRHQFDEDDIAASLSLPTPTLDLDFRMSIRVKPKINVGTGNFGRQSWIPCIGGQFAGKWGKGIVLPGGQDTQTTKTDMSTHISARYLIQTNQDNPAVIICNIKGWWTGDKDIMDRLQDPVAADNIQAHRYKFRVTMDLETGDERFAHLNTGVWVGSGCRRGAEIVYDAYRVN